MLSYWFDCGMWLLLAVLFFILGVPSSCEPLEVDQKLEVLRLKPVPDWTPTDVALWVNATLGYGEYSATMLKHLVDGPALLRLTAEDIEEGFPLASPLHRVKMMAHIDLLRGNCVCSPVAGAVAVGDSLVTLLQAHHRQMCLLGGTALVFPRFSFIVSYIFDYEAYTAFVGPEELPPSAAFQTPLARLTSPWSPTTKSPTTLNALVHWVTMLLVPDLVLLCKVSWYLSTNWFLVPFLLLHTSTQAYNEVMLLYLVLVQKRPLFDVGMSLPKKIWHLWGWSLATPVVALLLSFLPVFVTYLVIIALGGYGLIFVIGMVMVVLSGSGGPAAEGEKPKDA